MSLRDLVELVRALAGRHALERIPREARPRRAHARAVDVDAPDEEGHVHEIVIIRRAEGVRRRGRRHSGDDAPRAVGHDADDRREVRAAPLGIEEEVRPVEHQEVRARPRHGVVERIGAVVEVDADLRRAGRHDAPRVVVGLLPRERLAGGGRREIRDPAREVADLVRAGRPRRQREQHRRVSRRLEVHLHLHHASRGERPVEGDAVRDIGHRRRRRGGDARPGRPGRGPRAGGPERRDDESLMSFR